MGIYQATNMIQCTNILLLISMCKNVTLYWCHWCGLVKSSKDILSLICFDESGLLIASHILIFASDAIWDIAMRYPFSQNQSMIVFIDHLNSRPSLKL